MAGGAAAVAAASCVPSPGVPHPLPPLLTALGPPPQRHSGACKTTTGWTPLQRATSVWHRTSTRNVERAVGVTTNTTTATLDRVAATPPAQDACTGRQAASHNRHYTDEVEPSPDPLKTPSTPSTRTAQGHASPWPGARHFPKVSKPQSRGQLKSQLISTLNQAWWGRQPSMRACTPTCSLAVAGPLCSEPVRVPPPPCASSIVSHVLLK